MAYKAFRLDLISNSLSKILKRIAIKNGVSVTQTRQDIQDALDEGWNSSDENVRVYWHKIPTRHKKPTLEEVILYIFIHYN